MKNSSGAKCVMVSCQLKKACEVWSHSILGTILCSQNTAINRPDYQINITSKVPDYQINTTPHPQKLFWGWGLLGRYIFGEVLFWNWTCFGVVHLWWWCLSMGCYKPVTHKPRAFILISWFQNYKATRRIYTPSRTGLYFTAGCILIYSYLLLYNEINFIYKM